MADEKRKGLGRGLSALMGEPVPAAAPLAPRASRELPIEQLHPGRFQPRKRFDEAELDALAGSIREVGLVQPIVVRKRGPGEDYEIVAGERRWRAAQRAGLHAVPVVVREINDTQAMEFALVENLQRQDLNALEEAQGYRRMIDEFGHTQEQVAKVVGKSRSHVANTLRLLGLPAGVRLFLEDGRLSPGHARALLGAAAPETLAKTIVDKGLNVRQAERLAQDKPEGKSRTSAPAAPAAQKDADTRELEANLSAGLGLSVTVDFAGDAGGEVRIKYATLEQLDEVCRRLSRTD